MGDLRQNDVRYANGTTSGAGDHAIVAAAAGKKVRVLGIQLRAPAAETVQLMSGVGGAAVEIAPELELLEDESYPLWPTDLGYCETKPGDPLNLNTAGTAAIAWMLQYVEV